MSLAVMNTWDRSSASGTFGTFGTFYHFVLLRTFFGEKIATFLRQAAAANAETTKSTAAEPNFWYFLPKLPKQINGL